MKNIYLIGYRATGKTTVGKALAAAMDRPFVDADEMLEREQGRTIAEIVEAGGWEEFRRLEKELLKRLSGLDRHIIAPGGGAILDPDNVQAMQGSGLVVWLTADPKVICNRLAGDDKTETQRPALTDQGVLDEINTVLEQRIPLYKKAAMLTVSTEGIGVDEICRRILDLAAGRDSD
ncbi:Shikimate kinase [Desulfatibacillum aliphaticivorans]|uniref:Shikimate kinase n=1 Tax=Desulfatibacillum aliphaticivorans TaxID=218208 RepID=B8FFQ5_DESAL|nr:shikimate kinase [Desulfatibacillum aliphaticivorans]ACL03460.1 Shikimate kinase [Desulfatibacillum aliphaticivorans]